MVRAAIKSSNFFVPYVKVEKVKRIWVDFPERISNIKLISDNLPTILKCFKKLKYIKRASVSSTLTEKSLIP